MTETPINFSLSTLSAAWMRPAAIAEIAAETGFTGIDLAAPTRFQRAAAATARGFPAKLPLSSVWVSPGHSVESDVEFVLDRSASPNLTTMVYATSPLQIQSARPALVTLARDTLGLALGLERVCLSVLPRHSCSTREHLAALNALRMQAEEWGFGLALDLAHDMDWSWEAEAAVTRLMPALELIRLRLPQHTFQGQFSEAIALRAVNTALELGFQGTIAVIAPGPSLPFGRKNTMRSACTHSRSMLPQMDALRPMSDGFWLPCNRKPGTRSSIH